MRRDRGTRAAIGIACSLIIAACGSQLDRSLFETTAGDLATDQVASPTGQSSTGSPSATVPGQSSTADPSGPLSGSPSATAAPTPGASSGPDPATPTDTAAPDPGAPGGPEAKANYASDVGVTANSIKLGNITTVGGPMPGQFEPWLLGVRTWVNETNEKGGLNGRKIEFIPCDDAMDAERNRACARDLIENQKVFAILGTNTPAMPSADYVNEQKVPAVGIASIGNYAWQLPYWFSADGMRVCPRNGVTDPAQPGYCSTAVVKSTNATYKFYKERIGVSKAAVFWHNIGISKQAGLDFVAALKGTGIEVVYTAETQVAEPDYTGHVLQMRDRGAEGIWDAMEINNNIRLMQAMDRQGFLPKAKIGTAATYSEELGKQVTGPSRNILFVTALTRPYTDLQNPAINSFVQSFDKYFADKSKHIWNVEGYKGAKMFEAGAKALGADLTRQGLVDWLNALENFDTGHGVPMDYKYWGDAVYNAPKPPVTCYGFAQFREDDYYKVNSSDAIECIQGDWVEPRS